MKIHIPDHQIQGLLDSGAVANLCLTAAMIEQGIEKKDLSKKVTVENGDVLETVSLATGPTVCYDWAQIRLDFPLIDDLFTDVFLVLTTLKTLQPCIDVATTTITMRHNCEEIKLSLDYNLPDSLLAEAQTRCVEFITGNVFRTASENSDLVDYPNGLIPGSNLEKDFRFGNTEGRTTKPIIGVIYVASSKNSGKDLSHKTPTNSDTQRKIISEFCLSVMMVWHQWAEQE